MKRRTLSEIYDAIALEKANMTELNKWYTDESNPGSVLDDHQTLLNDLTSASKVAVWRLIIWIVAFATWIHEGLWFEFKDEIETMIENEHAHTIRWYQEKSFDFQYGDELKWNETKLKYEYENYDENKRIIARAAAEEANGIVVIKVAKNNNGVLAPLDSLQKTAFEGFWKKFKDAGVLMNIISDSPDLLRLEYQIFYDPMIMDEHGSLIEDGSSPVEEAINNYLANLDFNGRFRLEECDAAVRSAKGVVDFQRLSAKSKYGLTAYTDIVVSRTAYAGYFIIDPDYPLSDLITYTANV